MKITELQQKIVELKKKNDICIMAHAYQSHDIREIADYVGDSFGLSLQARKAGQRNILMCGVRFMAETVKILSPEKRVILANPESTCPMAEQYGKRQALELKKKYPGYTVVSYINTTAELKTVTDVVVTSSSAVKILDNMPENDIIFLPDPNLGGWLAGQLPQKNIELFDGGCPIHMEITEDNVKNARETHPDALILIHPECVGKVSDYADYIGSTTGIMDFAKNSKAKEFIIGTENSIVSYLRFECPEKKFYPLSKKTICADMYMTSLVDVYEAVAEKGGEEIKLEDHVIAQARKPIDRMIELGG